MPQQLKVFQDPSIVRDVAPTALEQLQNALEAKAGRIASGQESFTPIGVAPAAQPNARTSQGFLPYPDLATNRAPSPLTNIGAGPGSWQDFSAATGQRPSSATPRQSNGFLDFMTGALLQNNPPPQPLPARAPKVETRLAPNNGVSGIEQMQAFVSGQPTNSALGAIGQATSVPLPFARPFSGGISPIGAGPGSYGNLMGFAGDPVYSGGSSTPMYRRGQTSPGIASVQSQLGVKADGIFGPKTDAAVRAFQKANGLKVDGIVGPQTMAALNRGGGGVAAALSRPASTATPAKKSSSVAKALSSPSASTYGSKGLSAEGKALAAAFGRNKK